MQRGALPRHKHILFKATAVAAGLTVSHHKCPFAVDQLDRDSGKGLEILQHLSQPLDRDSGIEFAGHKTTPANDNFSFKKAILASCFGLYYNYNWKTIG
jgi:hypothetical protein